MPMRTKEEQKEYGQKHYQKYKQQYKERCNKRRIEMKKKAIEYLGGKCIRCGYDKCQGAFDFHHREDSQKEFQIAPMIWAKWEILQPELDKCDLLCSNCHREEHWNNNRI